jgi:hypothetical protein
VRLVVCLKKAGSSPAALIAGIASKTPVNFKESQMFVENLLIYSAEFVVLAFAAIATFDFVLGLHRLCQVCGTQPRPQEQQVETVLALASELQHQYPEAFEAPVVEDPWEAAIATPTCCCTTATITAPMPLLLLPPARIGLEQPKIDLTALKLYKLHGHSVVRVVDLMVEIPASIKRYKLHKRDVVRLIDLEHSLAAL